MSQEKTDRFVCINMTKLCKAKNLPEQSQKTDDNPGRKWGICTTFNRQEMNFLTI